MARGDLRACKYSANDNICAIKIIEKTNPWAILFYSKPV
jgi:hypothetical protein